MATPSGKFTIGLTVVCCGLFLGLYANSALHAQSGGANVTGSETSCRSFVQGFYDWYVPKALKAKERPVVVALKYRAQDFSPELTELLRDDSAAQAKSSDIVSLDFDPFTNSQDPSSHFVVEHATYGNTRCNAEVRGVEEGKKQEKVMPELEMSNGHWVFVNFLYGDSGDLVSLLKLLRKDRERDSK